ncbi:uncharacterized protein [Palaemon carinicauda]|uniref:uncharacterized protein n=1 Tax=Palaemon carinicauda TaxID=392227 RepID=UPI0035B5B1C4
MQQQFLLVIYLTMVTSVAGSKVEPRWKVVQNDTRYNSTEHPVSVSTYNMTRVMCGIYCFHRADCVSFNHNPGTDTCDILNTAYYRPEDPGLIEESGWVYYNFIQPKPPKDASHFCPNGSAYVQYEQPVYLKYDYSLDGYTCTNHPSVTALDVNGQNCRFTVMYDVDYPMATSPNYDGVAGPYYDAFKHCLNNSCAAMTCSPDQCWLKTDNHELTSASLQPVGNITYWYTVCN